MSFSRNLDSIFAPTYIFLYAGVASEASVGLIMRNALFPHCYYSITIKTFLSLKNVTHFCDKIVRQSFRNWSTANRINERDKDSFMNLKSQ